MMKRSPSRGGQHDVVPAPLLAGKGAGHVPRPDAGPGQRGGEVVAGDDGDPGTHLSSSSLMASTSQRPPSDTTPDTSRGSPASTSKRKARVWWSMTWSPATSIRVVVAS